MGSGSVNWILLEHTTCISFVHHVIFNTSTVLPTLLATSRKTSFIREFFGVLGSWTQLYLGRCLPHTIWIRFRGGCPNTLSHCDSCMIRHCSGSSHDHYKCSLYHSILLWCSWGVYSKIIPNSFLSDSLTRTLFSPALSHLIILTWLSCLASFFKRNSSYTLLLPQPTLPNVVFLPYLVFSLMRCPNMSFLQDFYFNLCSSLGNFFVLFSPMSSSGNY